MQRDAARLFSSSITSRVMRGFALYVRRRQTRRERNALARWSRDACLVKRHLQCWGSNYNERTEDKRKGSKSAGYFYNSSLGRAFKTWHGVSVRYHVVVSVVVTWGESLRRGECALSSGRQRLDVSDWRRASALAVI